MKTFKEKGLCVKKNKENYSDMAAELFIKPAQNTKSLMPPKSKEEYIKDLESCCTLEERLFALRCLMEVYRLSGLKNGGYYSEEGCNELIDLLRNYGKDVQLREHVAQLACMEGAYCERARDYPKAIKFYEASLVVFELNNLTARYYQYNNLAFCLNYSERFLEAEEYLRKAIAILPKQYNAWKNLGVSLEHQGQYEEAAVCYLKAIFLSHGEQRSRRHLDRLIERQQWLKESPAIKEWISDEQPYH